MRQDKKKHEKQKKRDRKNIQRKTYAERVQRERRRREQYPEVIIDETDGDAEFVQLVRTAVKAIDFGDPITFHETERRFFRLVREQGFFHARSVLQEAMRVASEAGSEIGRFGEHSVLHSFGHQLLNGIAEDARRRLMPYNDVLATYGGNRIVLRFSSMLAEKGTGGTIFYSRRKPMVEFDGKKWLASFSRHAVERICERINPRYIDYSAAGDIHALFADCVYYEPIQLYGGQPAFILFDICDEPGFARYATYVEGILGKDNLDPSKGMCYHRVGYCPVVFEGEFAKAKTFLYPGYKSTPEYSLVLGAKLSRGDREMLLHQATTHDATEVVVNDNPQAIKWFHEHGISQVVQMKHPVFARPYSRI
jgi:hypothetical protein